MGTLAVDIETASPFREPDSGDASTEYFEWLAVAVGYREHEQADPDATVLFRRGGWDSEYTADLFDQLIEWCDECDIDRALTYNGSHFDLEHMGNWAADIDSRNVRTDAYANLQRLFADHLDLAPAATDRHEDELWDDQPILPLWKACNLEGVSEEKVWYEDYDFDEAYVDGFGIDDRFVKGEHVGRVLGERFVDGVTAGLEETKTHRELRQLLYDYAVGDVEILFGLYDSLGGDKLDPVYERPLAEVEQ